MLSALSIVFLFNVTSFGVVLLLGGPGPTTLEVEIYRQTAQLLNLRTAAALAIVQLVGIVALLIAYARSQERLAVTQRLRPASETARPPRTRANASPLRASSVPSLSISACRWPCSSFAR